MRGRALPRGGAAAGDFGRLSLTARVLHGAFGPSTSARSFPGVPSGVSGGVFAAAWGSSVPEACGVGFKGSKGQRRRGRFVRGAMPGHRGEQGFEVGVAAPQARVTRVRSRRRAGQGGLRIALALRRLTVRGDRSSRSDALGRPGRRGLESARDTGRSGLVTCGAAGNSKGATGLERGRRILGGWTSEAIKGIPWA
jgi:hypothetical protein